MLMLNFLPNRSSIISSLLIGIIATTCHNLCNGFTLPTKTTTTKVAPHLPPSLTRSSVTKVTNNRNSFHSKPTSTSLNLVPLSKFESLSTILSYPDSYRACITERGTLRCDSPKEEEENNNNNHKHNEHEYVLCIAEEGDLPDISKLTIDAFGAESIALSNDLSPLEKAILQPGVGMWNAYVEGVAYTEVLSGLRKRMKARILDDQRTDTSAPAIQNATDLQRAGEIAAKSSLILTLARLTNRDSFTSEKYNPRYDSIEPIATVELRLQPTDAKIPFSEPWFDNIERKIAKTLGWVVNDKNNHYYSLQPYLSNLCVSEAMRGRNIGKVMVRCVERITKDHWGYKKLYLHVDLENAAALTLYKNEGYNDVGLRWNPFWAGKASEIGYFMKDL